MTSVVTTSEDIGGTETDDNSDMESKVACMFCDDTLDVTNRSAYSQHLREVHKVIKNLDILTEFIIEKEKGNQQVRTFF